jgi:hypothetical protein
MVTYIFHAVCNLKVGISGGRCYDHNFANFRRKNGVFSKTNVIYDQISANTGGSLSKKRQYFRQMFWRKYLIMITSVFVFFVRVLEDGILHCGCADTEGIDSPDFFSLSLRNNKLLIRGLLFPR